MSPQRLRRLRRLFSDDSIIYCECRTCGETLDEGEMWCSVCESHDVVRYEWSD